MGALTIGEAASRAGVRPSASKRWHTLARRKLAEMDALIARAERMK